MAEQENEDIVISSRLINASPETVFNAFADPELLAKWWGPKDFNNTFTKFGFYTGGDWNFIMHGLNGVDYPNESKFVSISPNKEIIFDHIVQPLFRMTISFEDVDGKTKFSFQMQFETGVLAKIKHLIIPANEENFDRLEQVLHTI